MRACEAIQLAIGEGLLAWERRVWHQLDRFTFVRDDGEGVVIAMTGRGPSLRAGATQSSWWCRKRLDCRVASLLAMTGGDSEPFASL